MTFSCTKKVLDKLKKYKPIDVDTEDIGLYNWYVNALTLHRKTYFLFTNSKTLFSFLAYAGTKKELTSIEQLFEAKLKEQITREISTQAIHYDIALKKNDTYRFTKTSSRVTLGCMNDFKNQIEYFVKCGESHERINHRLNDCPMKTLKYNRPRIEMRDMLFELASNK